MPLIGLPPYSPELNPAERVFEEVRREIEGKVYANLDEKIKVVQEFLTDLESDPERVRSLSTGLVVMASLSIRRLINSSREKQRKFKDRLLGIPVVELVYRAIVQFRDDNGPDLAAGVAYYGILSIFPLLIGIIALASFFVDSKAVQALISEQIQAGAPGSSEFLQQRIANIQRIRGTLSLFSIVGLIWTASAMFGAISRAVNRAWNVEGGPPFYIAKLRHIAMALGTGVLLVVSSLLITSRVFLSHLEEFIGDVLPFLFLSNYVYLALTELISVLMAFAVFLVIYKFIPHTDTDWSDIWLGALVAALLFELGRNAFVFYLNNFGNFGQIYGSLAAVMVLLVWIFISALILIIGAEVASEFARMKRGIQRGVPFANARSQG
ncbi:MAG TPA: YhjD/YihY/BrkB family envelope integrity protein [Dehalococcoidia bacterium]|nr:YhjD/YihY/BrkB family envelope integrity protein [Dehalococcoidia bacterium]